MNEPVYALIDESITRRRHELAVETGGSFSVFSKQVFADGALPTKVKRLIAVASPTSRNSLTVSTHTRRLRSKRAPSPRR